MQAAQEQSAEDRPTRRPRRDRQGEVRRVLAEGPMTAAEVASHLGGDSTPGVVQSVLDSLYRKGEVEVVEPADNEHPRYRLEVEAGTNVSANDDDQEDGDEEAEDEEDAEEDFEDEEEDDDDARTEDDEPESEPEGQAAPQVVAQHQPVSLGPIRRRHITKVVPVHLTDAEKAKLLDELAGCLDKQERLKEELKEAQDSIKGSMATVGERIRDIRSQHRVGHREDYVSCWEIRDYGRKEVRIERADTGEVVDCRPMKATETQVELDFGAEVGEVPATAPAQTATAGDDESASEAARETGEADGQADDEEIAGIDPMEFSQQCYDLIPRVEALPDAATDFAADLPDKLEGMATWAEEHDRVTVTMAKALEGITSALEKWEGGNSEDEEDEF